jgi:hypothetical protein
MGGGSEHRDEELFKTNCVMPLATESWDSGISRGCGRRRRVVEVGDFGAVEGSGDEGFVGAEVVAVFSGDSGRCVLRRGALTHPFEAYSEKEGEAQQNEACDQLDQDNNWSFIFSYRPPRYTSKMLRHQVGEHDAWRNKPRSFNSQKDREKNRGNRPDFEDELSMCKDGSIAVRIWTFTVET